MKLIIKVKKGNNKFKFKNLRMNQLMELHSLITI